MGGPGLGWPRFGANWSCQPGAWPRPPRSPRACAPSQSVAPRPPRRPEREPPNSTRLFMPTLTPHFLSGP